jgi:hypothetical protein
MNLSLSRKKFPDKYWSTIYGQVSFQRRFIYLRIMCRQFLD